jgi:enoyl-CoA hydratase
MIERHDEGTVTVLQLHHKKANALDVELLGALVAELDAAERDGRAIVLTGSGSIFCAGVDLFRVLEGGEPYLAAFLPALDTGLMRLLTFGRPAVAAINGHALAGGWILACACDQRVMTLGSGRAGLTEMQVGVAFPPVALETVRLATPPTLLPSMVLAARTFTGDEALRAGLVEEAVDAEEVLPRAIAIATSLAKVPAAAYRLTKEQLRKPTLDRIAAAQATTDAVRAQWMTGETVGIIRAYLDRVVHKRG